jgi:hypothetical protein
MREVSLPGSLLSSCCTVTLKYTHKLKGSIYEMECLTISSPPLPTLFLRRKIQGTELHTRWAPYFVFPVRVWLDKTTIVLFVWLGVEDGQNCLREIPILLHVSYFCAVGKKRKSVDPKQEHWVNCGKHLRYFYCCFSWSLKEMDWSLSSSCNRIHFMNFKVV